MATTYANIVQKVRNWANRDVEALPDIVIQDSLRWAADTAYRNLMIPPLEFTQDYLAVETGTTPSNIPVTTTSVTINDIRTQQYSPPSNVELPIPSDASTFLQIRIKGSANVNEDGTLNLSAGGDIQILDNTNRGIVFNEKVDVRTYNDFSANVVSDAFWTRQIDCLLLSGYINANDVIELYYYRRLPALDARYLLVATDYTAATTVDPITEATFSPFVDITTKLPGVSGTALTATEIATLGLSEQSLTADDFTFLAEGVVDDEGWYTGIHTDNWLRDDNERILVFGALNECFSYLADDSQAQKYLQKYTQEIGELNKEEKKRKASGGNVQVHYNSRLI